MNQKGFALLPVILWVVGSIAAISVLTSVTTPQDSNETQILEDTTQTQYNQPTSNQDLPMGDGDYTAESEEYDETYDQADPLVQCNFKSGTRHIKKSECGQMVDCQIGDNWIPATKARCNEAQEKLANLTRDYVRSALENQYSRSLLDSSSPSQIGSTPDLTPDSPSSLTPSNTPEINVFGGADSYTKYGNTLYGSDGSSYSQYGNTVYGNDGSSYSQYGNTIYDNEGSSWTKYSNTTYGNDGTSYTQYGNTTYGSDGSSYTQYGNTIYTNP